ncbi:glycosyltransferase family 39 protein [Acidobacteriota bacterium]
MLEGKIPYKDFYSLTAYGIFFTYAFFIKIFGMSMVSIHIGHLLISITTVVLVYFLTHYLYGQKAALVAALCYTLFSNGLAFSGFGYENLSAWGTYWYLSQREVFMAPLILGAVFLTIIGEEKNKVFLFAVVGLLVGLAAFYKLTAVLFLIIIGIFTTSEDIIKEKRFYFKKVFLRLSLLAAGFILVQLPFLYYFWINQALGDVHQALFVHLPLYVNLSRGRRIETLFSGHFSILSENLVLWLFAAISCLYIFAKDKKRYNILIALWGICTLLMVWGQGKFFGYHFLLIVPPFSVLVGYGLPKFFNMGKGVTGFLKNNLVDIKKTFMLATIVISLIGFAITNYDYYKKHAEYFLGKITKQEYYDVFSEFPTHPYSFRSDYQIAEFLNEIRESHDRLGLIFSAGDTVIHFLTGMKPVTRFIQSWYLFPSDDNLAKNEITVKLRKEFVDDMINTAPRFILSVHIPLHELIQLHSLEDDRDIRRLYEFVKANYTLKEFPDNRFLFIQNRTE